MRILQRTAGRRGGRCAPGGAVGHRAWPGRVLLACALACGWPGAGGVAPVAAQRAPIAPPHAHWKILETEHFHVLYTREVEPWTEWLAARLDPLLEEVASEVGFAPPGRLTLIVDDATLAPGGEVLPFLSGPILLLDPTPMEPRWTVAGRPWPAVVAAHELTHAVQSSMGGEGGSGLLGWLDPFRLAPIARKAPRWVTEGYATLLEGRLTGSNATGSVFRAAVLRTWGVARQLPTYNQLNFSEEFLGANMAYLVGAAFLEQLELAAGPDALPRLWARLAEPDGPGFQQAFLEIFGNPAPVLYEVFREALAQRALGAYDVLATAGLREGDRLYQFHWRTAGLEGGDPALSPDAQFLAMTVRPAGENSRVEVWDRLRLTDPARPPPVVASLDPVAGYGHESPRFFPDGSRLLISRRRAHGPAGEVHDLFEWNWRTGAVRQVTSGAGVREADPAPDGGAAVAIRVAGGITDLVRVELATGAVEVLAAGSPTRTFARPRYAPDGQRVAVVVQDEGRPRIAVVDVSSGELAFVDPDDGVSRYDPAWLDDGRLAVVSERDGVADVAILRLDAGTEEPVTRLATGAFWPVVEPDGHVLFMALHPEGLDLRRVALGGGLSPRGPTLPGSLTPAVPVTVDEPAPLPEVPVPEGRDYGRGARLQDLLPGAVLGPDAFSATLTFRNRDLLRRLTWSLMGAFGDGALWRGAASTVVWRDRSPNLTAHAFVAEQQPSRGDGTGFAAPRLDALYAGVLVKAGAAAPAADSTGLLALGATAGHLHARRGEATRAAAFAEAGVGRTGGWSAGAAALRLRGRGEAGWTGGAPWARLTARVNASVDGAHFGRFQGEVTAGRLFGDADAFEFFVLGGPTSPLLDPDLLAHRLAVPALEFGARGGDRILTARVEYTLSRLPTMYAWMGDTQFPFEGRTWMVGAEKRFFADDPRLPWLVPGMSTLLGAGMELAGSSRSSRTVKLYLALSYTP